MNPVLSPDLHALLTGAGYDVAVRTDGWSECFVHRGAEHWLGRGRSEDAAVTDVLNQLFPSHVSRLLLERHLALTARASPTLDVVGAAPVTALTGGAPLITAPTDGAPAVEELVAPPPPSAEAAPERVLARTAVAPLVETPPAASAPVVVALPAITVVPPPAPPVETKPSEIVRAKEVPVAKPEVPAVVPRAPVEPEKPLRLRTAEAMETVELLLAEIEERLGPLARMSADRQRLHMLVWICRARAVEESLPGVRDVEHAVARVARRLTEIGKMFWPGSVRALQLSARPADVRREMHATWASESANWTEATGLAERLLNDHLAKSNEAALDEDGWADGALRTPRPPEPDALFDEVDNELKALLIPPGEVPNGRLGDLSSSEIDALLHAARKLRWLRGAVKDDLAWGIAMGRLRRAVPGLADRAQRVRDVLDHRMKPPSTWAKLIGDREAEPVPVSTTTESPAKLKAELPAASETKEGLLGWLIRAFDVLNTPDLVALMIPLKAEVTGLGEDALNHPDRRVRRRLRELVRRIEIEGAAPASAPEPAPEPEEAVTNDEPLAAPALDALSARVRAQTKGARALFVSNREDPELGARLEELLGINIAWCDGSLRRVQAACERISRGTYDLVLSATGFQVHGVDSALARASGAARIPYVRVNRGRPVACIQAIAREFGLQSGTFPNPAAVKLATGS